MSKTADKIICHTGGPNGKRPTIIMGEQNGIRDEMTASRLLG